MHWIQPVQSNVQRRITTSTFLHFVNINECVKLILFPNREQYRYQIVLNKYLHYNCHCFYSPVKLTIPLIHLVSLISYQSQNLHPQSILETSLPITSRAFGLRRKLSYSRCNMKSVICPTQYGQSFYLSVQVTCT